MQKGELDLHIYGVHLLNPHKTVVSHLKSSIIPINKYRECHITDPYTIVLTSILLGA